MNIVWNDGYYFEAMDRCNTVMVLIDEILDGHPAIEKVGAQKDIDAALACLMNAYQRVGEVELNEGES